MPGNPSTPSHVKLGGQSIRSGAYQFIPIPFIDDWLLSHQRKSMISSVLKKRGFSFDSNVPHIISGGSTGFLQRAGSLAKGAIQKPLRKVFRTLFFWLTARRAAVTALETYFLGRLLHHPAIAGKSSPDHLTEEDARRIIAAFRKATKNIDLKTVSSAVSLINPLVRKAKGTPAQSSEIRQKIEAEKPGLIAKFEQEISDSLS
ncbi:hypothetical protein [Luteolibacter sp. AS25]|uniref:hypothetical protein n=1 Tax=Luteolibacter sp. AS25 TaxID=3135776 RepID=UPI00398AA2B1